MDTTNSATRRGLRGPRTVVGVAAVAALVAISASGASVLLADDLDDGRDPGARPGASVDQDDPSAPVLAQDAGDRETPGSVSETRRRSSYSFRALAFSVDSQGVRQNGRGGLDPVVETTPDAPESQGDPDREFDTDSGEAPPPPGRGNRRAKDPTADLIVDQDEPGVEQPAVAGDDLPSNDSDGDA